MNEPFEKYLIHNIGTGPWETTGTLNCISFQGEGESTSDSYTF